MLKKIKSSAAGFLKKKLSGLTGGFGDEDRVLFAKGILLQQLQLQSTNIQDYEFKVFSQFGDDGIIQYLIRKSKIINEYFIEFGVEDYSESNTRFLLMNNNWSGFIMDACAEAMKGLEKQPYFWKHDLRAQAVFITKENINHLISEAGWQDIGLLHIDLDGNDYWIWKEMDISRIRPTVVVLEYNSVFGQDRAITVPYKQDFYRTKAHFSNLYWGASLKALVNLSEEKGYVFVGCNTAGNNAYFIRKDRLNDLRPIKIEDGYVASKFRESRDEKGSLTLIRDEGRMMEIKGLPVVNTETGQSETL